MQEKIDRLVAHYGAVPPPWVMYDEHPYGICWRMGGGEDHVALWWPWWKSLASNEREKVAYFRLWPPPYCWLHFLIHAIWDAKLYDHPERAAQYFERTKALGFGGEQDCQRDLKDPKWLKRRPKTKMSKWLETISRRLRKAKRRKWLKTVSRSS